MKPIPPRLTKKPSSRIPAPVRPVPADSIGIRWKRHVVWHHKPTGVAGEPNPHKRAVRIIGSGRHARPVPGGAASEAESSSETTAVVWPSTNRPVGRGRDPRGDRTPFTAKFRKKCPATAFALFNRLRAADLASWQVAGTAPCPRTGPEPPGDGKSRCRDWVARHPRVRMVVRAGTQRLPSLALGIRADHLAAVKAWDPRRRRPVVGLTLGQVRPPSQFRPLKFLKKCPACNNCFYRQVNRHRAADERTEALIHRTPPQQYATVICFTVLNGRLALENGRWEGQFVNPT